MNYSEKIDHPQLGKSVYVCNKTSNVVEGHKANQVEKTSEAILFFLRCTNLIYILEATGRHNLNSFLK